MKIIEPSVEIITPINGIDILKHIETCGRVCYKSEDMLLWELKENIPVVFDDIEVDK